MAVMGVSVLACSSDDNSNGTPDYKTEIQGTWKDSKIIFLDKDKKVIGEQPASNNDGCGNDELEFKGDVWTSKYSYKYINGDINECRTETSSNKFVITGSKISITDEEGYNEEYEITEVSKSKLVLLDLEPLTESAVEGEKYPKGTTFVKLECVSK
ncbi:lipocalin-like domain-containing protein [Myroides pelagicus]|uniref:Lipocalin-like domain-containing protein n=1 Tax=Myroides pelagicus TaxID=270914 RepID=A0A7K1GN80_9FLAO|nr:lipocalin family protein [Myroides pelagicus]MTH30362.1 hypothetical protein [Myroides pelagicus]